MEGGVVWTHQALALLAVLHPCVAAAVGEQAVLVQALAAQAGVALRATEQVSVGVVAVAHHPAAHHLASLGTEDMQHSHAQNKAMCVTESLNMYAHNK